MVIAFYSDEKGAIIGVTHVEIKAKNTGKKNAATSDGPRNSATNRFPPFAAKQLTGAEQVGEASPLSRRDSGFVRGSTRSVKTGISNS
jgi:hypothetical protein